MTKWGMGSWETGIRCGKQVKGTTQNGERGRFQNDSSCKYACVCVCVSSQLGPYTFTITWTQDVRLTKMLAIEKMDSKCHSKKMHCLQ